jgi:signal peptidase II
MLKEKSGWIILSLVFLLDRLLKALSLNQINFWSGSQAVINHIIISGLFANSSVALVIALIVIIILIYAAVKYPADRLWLVWVIAGAASNVWDRLQYGGVIDYWTWSAWPWIFNLADLMIIGGLIWYLVKSYLARR